MNSSNQKDYRSQKTPVKMEKNHVVSTYHRPHQNPSYLTKYQQALNKNQPKNYMSPSNDKQLKVNKNMDLIIQYNFDKNKDDSNERYYETNDNQDVNFHIKNNDKASNQPNNKFTSPQNNYKITNALNNEVSSSKRNNPNDIQSINTIIDDESKLQIKELLDLCPEKVYENMNDSLSFINKSSMNSYFNPNLSNILSGKIEENPEIRFKKYNNDNNVESFRKKNVINDSKLDQHPKNKENSLFVKSKNAQNSVPSSNINRLLTPSQDNIHRKDDLEMQSKLKANDVPQFKLNLANLNKDKNKQGAINEHESDNENQKISTNEIINLASKKDPNYNSLARNFIFSYESDKMMDVIGEAKEAKSGFTQVNFGLEENKIEMKKVNTSNSYNGDNNDDNRIVYFNKLETVNPLNNSQEEVSISTQLFPVFEKNLEFEINSPTHREHVIEFDSNDSQNNEEKNNYKNMEINKLSNYNDYSPPKFSLNFDKIKPTNEKAATTVQEENNEEKMTTRNMVNSYTNFYNLKTNEYNNNNIDNNEELAKKINFFSNDGNLIVSVDEDNDDKPPKMNTLGLSKDQSTPFEYIAERFSPKHETESKFNFFESNDLKSSFMNNNNKFNPENEFKNIITPNKAKVELNSNDTQRSNDSSRVQFNQQLNQISEMVLFSPQNRANVELTPNYAKKFINTTTKKDPNLNEKSMFHKEVKGSNKPSLAQSEKKIDHSPISNKKLLDSKNNLNKSDLIIENTEKIIFESVKRNGSPQAISDAKNLLTRNLQSQIETNKPKINNENINNNDIKLINKNSQISIQTTTNISSYVGNSGITTIQSKKNIKDLRPNSFNINENSILNKNPTINRNNSKKNSSYINNQKGENKIKLMGEKKINTKPFDPKGKQIKKLANNNEVFSPTSKYIMSPSNNLSTNSQIYSPDSHYTAKKEIDIQTDKNTISDLLSPTSNIENISYISKFNNDTSKNNNNSISRTINTESSNKISTKNVKESTYTLDSKNPNQFSKKSILEDRVQFDKQGNPQKIMKNLLNKIAFSKDGYLNNFKDDLEILNIQEDDLKSISNVKDKK